VEFLIEWNLLPSVIGRLQVSERLVIEDAWNQQRDYLTNGKSKSYVLAYVGVEDEPSFFNTAVSYIEFFLLICALTSDISGTYQLGIGTQISDFSELGKRRIGFPSYEKVEVLSSPPELMEPILAAKSRFLQLEKDRQQIMDGYLGLALRYYYFALQSYYRNRIDEMIIDLAITAEALFTKESKNITRNLKCRLSSFIADNELERGEIVKKIDEFYSLRSAIVHGNKKSFSLSDVKLTGTAKTYIQKAIDKALTLKFYSKEELLQRIDETA